MLIKRSEIIAKISNSEAGLNEFIKYEDFHNHINTVVDNYNRGEIPLLSPAQMNDLVYYMNFDCEAGSVRVYHSHYHIYTLPTDTILSDFEKNLHTRYKFYYSYLAEIIYSPETFLMKIKESSDFIVGLTGLFIHMENHNFHMILSDIIAIIMSKKTELEYTQLNILLIKILYLIANSCRTEDSGPKGGTEEYTSEMQTLLNLIPLFNN